MGQAGDPEQRAALLAQNGDAKLDTESPVSEPLPTIPQELIIQAKMAVPLAIGHISNYILTVVSLAYVGHLGTRELAAASLAHTLYSLVARILLAGMLGGLDTFASQAVGAGKFDALGSLFRQSVLFLMLHTIPIAGVFVSLPGLLTQLGQSAEITQLVRPYLLALLPGIWVDAVYRPLNRIMIAQRVTTPTMWVSIVAAVQHVPATHFLVLKFGFLGAAYANVWSFSLALLLSLVYVWVANLHQRVWGIPNGLQFQSWLPFLKISYAACAMIAIAAASSSLLSVAAGWLPNPAEALATTAVASSSYVLLQMGVAAMTQTTAVRVGHGLGAGSAARAKLSARSAASVVPFLWATVATVLLTPPSQKALIGLFTVNPTESMLRHLRFIFSLLAVQSLLDMSNGVMSGMASGAGKQAIAFLIIVVANWVFALPTALLLAFKLHVGVEGLYLGVSLASVLLLSSYGTLTWRTRWEEEAERARRRVLGPAAARLLDEESDDSVVIDP